MCRRLTPPQTSHWDAGAVVSIAWACHTENHVPELSTGLEPDPAFLPSWLSWKKNKLWYPDKAHQWIVSFGCWISWPTVTSGGCISSTAWLLQGSIVYQQHPQIKEESPYSSPNQHNFWSWQTREVVRSDAVIPVPYHAKLLPAVLRYAGHKASGWGGF